MLHSIQKFYPEVPVAIFDDGSTDPTMISLLEEYGKQNIRVINRNHEPGASKHGGLYAAMNRALRYALEQKFRYAYFVQDDMQFLWRDDDMMSRLDFVFKKVECIMCNFNFLRKILREGIQDVLLKQDEELYSFKDHGVADTGIISLEKAQLHNLSFPDNSERGNGIHWYNKGFRLYWLPQAHLAWIPSPSVFRSGKTEYHKLHQLLPISIQKQTKLKTAKGYTYLEDYTKAPSLLIRPYWYTENPGWINLFKIYTKYYLKSLF